MDFAKTLAEVRCMAIEDRIQLVQAIWDEILADRASPDLTEEQRQELDRRLADDDMNPDDIVPWDEIKADALTRSQK